ncbi:HDOD domain-containing protein [Lysobacter sp. GX 14042]|uniref:HDOD domain-containing protein n=1 Tax=Lysobacter sp. GX 14042 TaxID=2907155 RepID=UPI001F332A59|nr:HDOD domain-containing protein [Lysobacter sp. GX 14042]MCE7032955.1 HDOD domain-containing protein [Lysobacter sp. GX 14042]
MSGMPWLLPLLGVLVVVGLAWAGWRRARPRGAPARGGGRRRAGAGFPPDPTITAASTLRRDGLRRLHGLPFGAAGEAATATGSAHAAVVARTVEALQKVGSDIRSTPRRPGLLPQLTRTVNDPHASGMAIAGIVAQDPTLAARLLKIANSALYRVQSRPVESLERAVASVGTDGIRRLVAAALVQPVMGAPGEGVFGELARQVWTHTELSSAAAAEHARRGGGADAFTVQLAGLMVGLGSAVVVRSVREQYLRRPALVPDAEVTFALLDGWSVPVARRIARQWELSDPLGSVLDALQEPGSAATGARSLRFGSAAASMAMLCRAGGLSADEALARLAGIEADAEAVESVWRRLCRSLEEGGTPA